MITLTYLTKCTFWKPSHTVSCISLGVIYNRLYLHSLWSLGVLRPVTKMGPWGPFNNRTPGPLWEHIFSLPGPNNSAEIFGPPIEMIIAILQY